LPERPRTAAAGLTMQPHLENEGGRRTARPGHTKEGARSAERNARGSKPRAERKATMSINRAAISGNLTRDATLRGGKSGGRSLAFTVAVNESRKNPETGEYEDYANFIPCIIFDKRAEALEHRLLKGTKVALEGTLRWSSWLQDDVKRERIEVVVSEIDFMSTKDKGQSGSDQELADEDYDF